MLLRHMTQFWTMLKCWVTTAQVSRTSEAGDSSGTVKVSPAGDGKHPPSVHGRVEQRMSIEHSLKQLFF